MVISFVQGFLASAYQVFFGSRLKDVNANTAKAALAAFVVALLAFGFELTNPTIGVDDYLYLSEPRTSQPWLYARGMWGFAFLQQIVPGHWIVPFVALFFGILLQLFSAVLLGWLFRYPADRLAPLLALYVIWVSFPYFAAQMAFSYLQIGYPLSTLLVILGLLFAVASSLNYLKIVFGGLLIAFGLGIYQGGISVLSVSAVMAPLAVAFASQKSRLSVGLNTGLRAISVSVLGGLFYMLIQRLLEASMDLPLLQGRYEQSLNFAFWDRLSLIQRDMAFLSTGAGDVIPATSVVLIAIGLLLTGMAYLLGKHSSILKLMAVAVFVMSFVAVFSVLFVKADASMSPRNSLGLALFSAVGLSAGLLLNRRYLNGLLLAIVSLVSIQFIFQINAMFYSQYLTSRADELMISRIFERVEKVYDSNEIAAKNREIIFAGSYSHPAHPHRKHYHGTVLGYSNFEWDGGNIYRMNVLGKAVGAPKYRPIVAPAELPIAGRDPWPAWESVFLYKGSAAVWLGDRRRGKAKSPIQKWWAKL